MRKETERKRKNALSTNNRHTKALPRSKPSNPRFASPPSDKRPRCRKAASETCWASSPLPYRGIRFPQRAEQGLPALVQAHLHREHRGAETPKNLVQGRFSSPSGGRRQRPAAPSVARSAIPQASPPRSPQHKDRPRLPHARRRSWDPRRTLTLLAGEGKQPFWKASPCPASVRWSTEANSNCPRRPPVFDSTASGL